MWSCTHRVDTGPRGEEAVNVWSHTHTEWTLARPGELGTQVLASRSPRPTSKSRVRSSPLARQDSAGTRSPCAGKLVTTGHLETVLTGMLRVHFFFL